MILCSLGKIIFRNNMKYISIIAPNVKGVPAGTPFTFKNLQFKDTLMRT